MKKKKRSVFGALLKTFLIIIVSILVIGGVGGFFYVNALSKDLPNIDVLNISPDQASQIFDYQGNLITNVYALENRVYVPLDQIAPVLQQAVLSQEDKRFFEHGALDYRGIARAIWVDITHLSLSEGASTLTQQLSRSLFLTMEDTPQRKIKEILIAIQLEKRYTKNQILEMYLNQVYFGSGAYGVESAAEIYFGKHASDVDLAEASMLAGVLQGPSVVNPFVDFNSAKSVQKEVLDKMVEQKVITQEEADAAYGEKIVLAADQSKNDNMGYVIDYVKQIIADKFGEKALYSGGLKIYTTVMPQLQLAATKAINNVLTQAEKDKVFPKGVKDSKGVIQPEASLTAVDTNTGGILAMVGGRDYGNTKYNRALALKQPGSSFKIFDYTTAISYGSLTPSSILVSGPYTVDNWSPHEWTKNYFGALSVRDALDVSSNVCAAKVSQRVGLDRVIYTARKLGITTPLMPYPSIAIGSFEVEQLQMADAYATLGNGGTYHPTYIIEKVVSPDGTVLYQHQDQSYRAVSEQTAYVMNNIFSYIMSTHYNAKISGLPSAGKTGSTDNWTDAWFDGYTPNISASVWVGPDSKEVTFPDVLNSGSRFPAMIWKQFMLEAMNYFPKDNFTKPTTGLVSKVVYNDTGYLSNLPSDGKTTVRYDFMNGFLPPPDPRAAGFVTVTIVKDSGLLAPPNCPPDLTEQRIYLKGTEPTEYDPRYLQGGTGEIPQINISTDQDNYIVGDQAVITADVTGLSSLDSYKVTFYAYNMPVATLTNPTGENKYQYKLILNTQGVVNIKVELRDQKGNVISTSSKSIEVKSGP
jgi:penicillin-binding protein 1A